MPPETYFEIDRPEDFSLIEAFMKNSLAEPREGKKLGIK
jgi:hypothetical protein